MQQTKTTGILAAASPYFKPFCGVNADSLRIFPQKHPTTI